MKKISLLLLFIGSITGCSTMAHAERIYLYKDVNDKNPKYDKLYRYRLDSKIDPAISVNISFPTQVEGEKDLSMNLTVGVKPSSKLESTFRLEIGRFSIRGKNENYALYPNESTQRRYGDKILVLDDGQISGGEPFEFDLNNTFGAGFGVRFDSELPENMYLDYKLIITSEEGQKDILEGTFVMEKTSCHKEPQNPFSR